MPKAKKVSVVATKTKLSPAERSQIAKDRWAKRRSEIVVEWPDAKQVAEMDVPAQPQPGNRPPPSPPDQPPYPQNPTPEQPPVAPESVSPSPIALSASMPRGKLYYTPAPQLAPVAPKKQKRYTGPKEFSVALKAAESRLAKAIVERAEASGKLAMLQAEIPSLVQIINALKGQTNIPVATYDPNATATQFASTGIPYQAPALDLGAIQTAMATPPISRAVGNAMQFSPDIVGNMEGQDDDDPDKFITGENAGRGWIGG